MTLRTIAEADLATVMESAESFRWPVVLTDPDDNTHTAPLYAIVNDVSGLIDPDTGQLVSGRVATFGIRISSITALGLGLPKGESSSNKRPWVVSFKDITGASHLMKVTRGDPDLTLGIINLYLEVYSNGS